MRQVSGIARPETRKIYMCQSGDLFPEKRLVRLPGACNYIVITCLEHLCKGDHPACMAETPLKGTDKYIIDRVQNYPDTLVLIPSLLTIPAIRLSSERGTFASMPPSGVSLDIVYIMTS